MQQSFLAEIDGVIEMDIAFPLECSTKTVNPAHTDIHPIGNVTRHEALLFGMLVHEHEDSVFVCLEDYVLILTTVPTLTSGHGCSLVHIHRIGHVGPSSIGST